MIVAAVAPLRNFFELIVLRPQDYLGIALLVLVWAVLINLIYRWQLIERLFLIP